MTSPFCTQHNESLHHSLTTRSLTTLYLPRHSGSNGSGDSWWALFCASDMMSLAFECLINYLWPAHSRFLFSISWHSMLDHAHQTTHTSSHRILGGFILCTITHPTTSRAIFMQLPMARGMRSSMQALWRNKRACWNSWYFISEFYCSLAKIDAFADSDCFCMKPSCVGIRFIALTNNSASEVPTRVCVAVSLPQAFYVTEQLAKTDGPQTAEQCVAFTNTS